MLDLVLYHTPIRRRLMPLKGLLGVYSSCKT